MKTGRKSQKNVCQTEAFLGVPKGIRIYGGEMPYLSGLPPSGLRKNHTERAVNMYEFLQLDGVQL